MPYLALIVPTIPEAHKDQFLAAWPTIAAEMKSQPMVLGVSAGPIVAEDGAAASSFKFLQSVAFATEEDFKAFQASPWAEASKKKYEEHAIAAGAPAGPPPHALFKVSDFPEDHTPPAFAQFSRVKISEDKKPELRKAWEDLMTLLGKKTFGGISVGGDDQFGLGLCGWDSLEEAGAAMQKPDVAAAWKHYHSLGECKDVMVKLEVY